MATFQTADELWFTVFSWLNQTGNKANKNFCKLEMGTHPDYPALSAVTDFLDAGAMQFHAVEADESYIHKFNYPLLAHIQQPGQEQLHIIQNAAAWEARKDITQYWSGVVIYPEIASTWKHEDNDAAHRRALRNSINFASIAAVALSLLALAVARNPSLYLAGFGLLSMAGIMISGLIIGTELGVQGSLVKQVCGAVSHGGCDSVLKSGYAQGFAGYSTGDIAFVYFAAQFCGLLFSVFYPALYNAVFIISLSGILIATWSVFTQALLVKQWCALCLGLVSVLLLQAGMALIHLSGQHVNFAALQFIGFLMATVMIALLLYPIKEVLKTNYDNKEKLAELKKWKMDPELFIAQWQQEQQVDTTVWENDLILGNPEAPIKITVACNPYCGPCARAHMELEALLNKFPNGVCIQLRFLCNADTPAERRTVVVADMIRNAITRGNDELSVMMSDWFKWENYEQWSSKWRLKSDADVSSMLKMHDYWTHQNRIAFTPTIFLNGKKLPGRYSLSEFGLLLPLVELAY